MLIRSCKPLVSLLNSCKNLSLKTFVSFYRVLVKKAGVSTYTKLNNGQKLKIRMRETSKVFNRIPLLALVNNRTRQNDGRISLQKQTSNDKRQSNLTKLVIAMSFVFWKSSTVRSEVISKAGMLLNSLVTQSTYCVILCLPCAILKSFLRREKTFAQRKLYVILKIIPLAIYIRNLVEFWIMAHGEKRGFLHRHFL